MKKRIFVDMDGVIADFQGAVTKLSKETYDLYVHRHDEVPGIFEGLEPIEGSVKAVGILKKYFDLFIASTPSWGNETSSCEKIN